MVKKICVFLSLVLFPFLVSAKVIESDYDIKLSGEYDSSKVLIGYYVSNESTIDGVGIYIAGDIVEHGNVDYGLYVGNSVRISGNIQKDFFSIGYNVTIEDAISNRDAFVIGNSLKVSSDVGRNLYVVASTVDLSDVKINGDVYVIAKNVVVNENTEIVGELAYNEGVNIISKDEAKIGSEEVIAIFEKDSYKDIIWKLLIEVISASITMLVILFIFPKFKNGILNYKVGKNTFTMGIIGLALLILVPLGCILGAFTIVMIPICLLLLVMYLIGLYLSFYIVSYYVGYFIFRKLRIRSNLFLDLISGIFLMKLIILIPIVGFLVKMCCIILGMGYLFNLKKLKVIDI